MACLSFLGCHSGLFSAAKPAAAKQPEKQEEGPHIGCITVDEEQQPPVGPAEATQGAANEAAPVCAWSTDVVLGAEREDSAAMGASLACCSPARAAEPEACREAAPSPDDKPEEPRPASLVDQDAPLAAAGASPEEPAPRIAEPEPAAPAHFEGSDPEDAAAGKAAKGCCVPRASKRRTKGSKGSKVQDAAATLGSASAGSSSKPKKQGVGGGKRGKSKASAGA
ncbi:unnamed protein product [Prorocentrum cordatum]|uniref:Uncharacterized protein n=1 Tax=Prorocentrum cordatum TaxID=2364126 RepID=A0ABN9VW56_9DINO|nr:unnamed protein product [Polarella glacialis]